MHYWDLSDLLIEGGAHCAHCGAGFAKWDFRCNYQHKGVQLNNGWGGPFFFICQSHCGRVTPWAELGVRWEELAPQLPEEIIEQVAQEIFEAQLAASPLALPPPRPVLSLPPPKQQAPILARLGLKWERYPRDRRCKRLVVVQE